MIGLAVRRPVATLTLCAALAVLGIPSLARMPVELLPDVDFPRLEVAALWPGASPEMVEARVTAPIEAAARTARGVRSVASTSYAGRAAVTVEFARGVDMEFARLELSERLAALARELPAGALPPVVSAWVPDEFAAESRPLLVYTLAGRAEPGALRETAREQVERRIESVHGVGAIDVVGGAEREFQVRLDPLRLAALEITPADVRRALAEGLNVSEAGAAIERGGRELVLTIDDRAGGAADVEDLVLRPAGPRTPAIRLGDVARSEVTWAEPGALYRVDGRPAVSLLVYGEPGANAIAAADAVGRRLAGIRPRLPPGHRLIEDYDQTDEIREELGDLRSRALVAAAVVLGVLLLAFRRLPPAALAFATIAVTILVAANLLRLAGLSLNLLTLAGLAMGFGLIVDNAIVVLEGIEARRASGEPAALAAVRGAHRVALPILAATATTGIVFVPFLYFQGELRDYYVPFALTVALVLAVSLAVSFTVVPAVAVRLPGSAGSPPWRHGRGALARRAFRALLERALARPRATTAVVFAILAASGWLFWNQVPRGREWGAWGEETFLQFRISMPRGAEIERTDEIARRIESRLASVPEVERFVTRVRDESAEIRVTFPDSLETTWIPVAIKERMVAWSHGFGGARVRVYGFGPSFHAGGGGPPSYALELKGFGYTELERLAEDLARRLRRFARIRDVDPNASGGWFERDRETELVLAPDRARLAGHGLSVEELLDRVAAATRGRVTRDEIMLGGEEIGLEVKLEGARDSDVEDLADLLLATSAGGAVRVRDVATIEPRETLGRIVREDQQYQRIVAYEFLGPPKLGDRVRDAVVAATALPPGYSIEAEPAWWEYEEGEASELALVLALAVALVFMVTAALFESLRAPLVVLAAVPLALIGVFLLWLWTDRTFTREAWIGVVMMAGIVVNNAILVVDRIGALRRGADGPSRPMREAAVEGTLDRLRPILMTTATTVLGLLPFVLFPEEGASSLWTALAMATVGGLASSTVFVMTIIPVLYVLVSPGPGR